VALQVFNAPNASDNENSVTVAQQYYAGGGSQTRVPRRVDLEVPTEVQVLPLPVEFKDLVLP
jgi:hypothetical protein